MNKKICIGFFEDFSGEDSILDMFNYRAKSVTIIAEWLK